MDTIFSLECISLFSKIYCSPDSYDWNRPAPSESIFWIPKNLQSFQGPKVRIKRIKISTRPWCGVALTFVLIIIRPCQRFTPTTLSSLVCLILWWFLISFCTMISQSSICESCSMYNQKEEIALDLYLQWQHWNNELLWKPWFLLLPFGASFSLRI